jgi:predicted RecB family endonuclease
MQTIANLTSDDLKQIIKESVKESVKDTLSKKKMKDIFYEVIEDIALSKAIDEGMQTESIDKNSFLKKLKSRIQQPT